MHLYQDCMAIVRCMGKPDLFITFTCNPAWPEITSSLLPFGNQTPADRPDLVSRVFRMKLDMLMEDLTKNKIFGEVKGLVLLSSFL